MEDDMFFSEGDDEIVELVKRYEAEKKNKITSFFDVSDFEEIINYYIENYDFNKALDVIVTATSQHPQSTAFQLKKAQIYIESGQPVKSIKILRNIEVLESGNPEFYIMKGSAYSLTGNISKALTYYNKAVDLDKDNEEEISYGISIILQHNGFYKESVNFLERAFHKNPKNKRYLYDLGLAYEKMDNLEKSINFYLKYIDEHPFSETTWYNLGVIYNKLGYKKNALEAFDFAIAINNENTFAIFHKANILTDQGKYRDALKEYFDYIRIEDDSIEGIIGIGFCYEKLRKYDIANKYYRKAIKEEPEFSEGWYGLASIAYEKENFDQSIANLTKAIKLDPDNTEYLTFLAQLLELTGKIEKAYNVYKKALEIEPENNDYKTEMVEMLLKNKLWKETLLEVNIDQKDKNISSLEYCYMAIANFGLGNENKGLFYLNTALKIDPEIIDTFYSFFAKGKDIKPIKKLIKNYKN